MPESVNKTAIMCKLEQLIDDGKKVVIFDCNNQEFLQHLRDEIGNRKINDLEIWQCIEGTSDFISKSELREVLQIYHTYDFSNKVLVVSDSELFGSIFNYVKNGIMTEEEMIEALLL